MDYKLKMKWKVGVYKGSGGVEVFHAGFVSAILQIAAWDTGSCFVFSLFREFPEGSANLHSFCSKLA